jgi:hypothetical protein
MILLSPARLVLLSIHIAKARLSAVPGWTNGTGSCRVPILGSVRAWTSGTGDYYGALCRGRAI